MSQPTNFVSVVVCTYNREKYIGKCLEHLHNQTAKKDSYEVIIVNNNSTDNTEQICKKVIQANPSTDYKYFIELKQGHTFSRNLGISESKGSIISFLDDDAFATENYIKNTLEFFDLYNNVHAIGGKIIPIYEENEPKWMSKYLLPLVAALDLGDKVKKFEGRKFPIGANMAFKKSVFQEIGLFDVNLGRRGKSLQGGDEKEVFMRLKKQNALIYYVPQIEVRHIIPNSRLEISYIKGLAYGVGESESQRLKDQPLKEKIKKMIDESLKIAATLLLSATYMISFQPSKALMLLRFRYWVIRKLNLF